MVKLLYQLRRLYALFFLINAVCFSASAQKDSVDLYNLSLEELMNIEVISASKKSQKLMEAPAIMTVMSKSEIEQLGVTSLIDVLKYVPGIETSLASDGYYRIAIRGNRKGGNILILIDGHELNDFYTGRALTDMPISTIEKIEVIRGPGSALFGTNAVAGVINIFLTEGTFAKFMGGLNGTYSTHLNHTYKNDNFKLTTRVGLQQDNAGPAYIETDAGDKAGNTWDLTYDSLRHKAKRMNNDAYLHLNLDAGNFNLYASSMLRRQTDWAGAQLIVAPHSEYNVNQNLIGMSYDIQANEFIRLVPQIYGSFIERDNLYQETPSNYFSNQSGQLFPEGKQTREKYFAKSYGAELDLYIKINEHLNLLTGNVFQDLALSNYSISRNYQIVGDIYKQTFGNYDNISLSLDGKRRFVFAYFLQADYKWRKVDLTLGLRYDDYSDFGSSLNPRIGLNWRISDYFRLKGLYGKAFRAPTFEELYDNSTIGNEYGILGNSELKPETIQTFEIGSEYQKNKWLLRYNAYFNVNTNLIRVYDPHGGGSIGEFENIGATHTVGHEFEIRVDLNKRIQIQGDFSQYLMFFYLNDSMVSKADQVFYDQQHRYYKQMLNIPRIRFNLGVNMSFGRIRAFAGINYGGQASNNSRFYLEKGSYVEIPAYLQGNVMISWKINNQWQLRLAVNNIGTKYVDPEESTNIDAYGLNGLIQPGIGGILGITYKLADK